MASVIVLGETFVDVEADMNSSSIGLKMNLGGACANVASEIAIMGGRSSVITKVRNDVIGKYIVRQLKEYGVNTDQVLLSNDYYRTTVNFIVRSSDEVEYITYDNDCVENHIEKHDVDYDCLDYYDIFHFGSRAAVTPTCVVLNELIVQARQRGLKISYDVNARPGFWKDDREASETIRKYVLLSDYVKMNADEARLLLCKKSSTIQEIIELIAEYSQERCIIVTDGINGSYVIYNNDEFHVESYEVATLDTVGAGDAYYSVFLHQIKTNEWSAEAIKSACVSASVISSLTTKWHGTIDAFLTAFNEYRNLFETTKEAKV